MYVKYQLVISTTNSMSPNYKEKKVDKKQRRCEAIIEKDCNIKRSDQATTILSILNAGCTTGLTEEELLVELSQYGSILQTALMPGKSYCFVQCASVADAENIYSNAHNRSRIGQNGAVVFLSFFEKLPDAVLNVWLKDVPNGIFVIPNFVSVEEETEILKAIGSSEDPDDEEELKTESALKHRRVKHFGYEFLYGVNTCDPDRPMKQQVPSVCQILWPRLKSELQNRNFELKNWHEPDQLTVNFYDPGQGIPPHVDTHSAFFDPILSLSLLGGTVMEFRRGIEKVPVLLPARSLLVLSGESRYDWTHGITPRFQDVIPTPTGALTTQKRTKRISLTFRKLRRGPCDCRYPALCDTRLQQAVSNTKPKLEELATSLEESNVHKVYDQIASHFSETRHTPWPQVVEFLHSFSCSSVLVDVGCGNGKYLQCSTNSLTIGCDRSQGLLEITASRGNSVFRCDCLSVPLRSGSVDGCFSIAVIHHLATVERRLQALREMARVLRKNGRALVYVWAKDQRKDTKKSSYLLQNKAINKKKTTEDQQRQETIRENHEFGSSEVLPIHTNRTNFEHQDVLVPWKLKDAIATKENSTKNTFLRYYHVFEEGELEELLKKVPDVTIVRSYYDQGNHCVIFQRR